jgi:hypothetical protein
MQGFGGLWNRVQWGTQAVLVGPAGQRFEAEFELIGILIGVTHTGFRGTMEQGSVGYTDSFSGARQAAF